MRNETDKRKYKLRMLKKEIFKIEILDRNNLEGTKNHIGKQRMRGRKCVILIVRKKNSKLWDRDILEERSEWEIKAER